MPLEPPPPTPDGHELLAFRCTSCGDCCRRLRVAVTHYDLARLVAATGLAAHELVAWLGPDEVDMTGEPEAFVELASGRRLLVLAQRDGACRLLQPDLRCSAYAARPRDCELYPFEPELDGTAGLRRLRLLPPGGCEGDFTSATSPGAVAAAHTRRERELGDYRERVQRWNRLAKLKRRFGHPLGNAARFVTWLLDGAVAK